MAELNGTRIFSVDKFLGLNESADGETELKLGEASRIENFYVTDDHNLKARPGISMYYPKENGPGEFWTPRSVSSFWEGYIGGRRYFLQWKEEIGIIRAYSPELSYYDTISGLTGKIVNIIQNGKDVFVITYHNDVIYTSKIYIDYSDLETGVLDIRWSNAVGYLDAPYIPLVKTECTPDGSGTTMEPLNILVNKFRVQYVSEEQITEYTLPKMADRVVGVHIGGYAYEAEKVGSYDVGTHKFILKTHPAPGVDVVFVCQTEDADLKAAKERFLKMRFHEYFNGDTDTRVFFYGDGSNVCYYTGVPAFADSYGYSPLGGSGEGITDGTQTTPSIYIPAGNEIAVDFSDSAITSMVRHYSRLLVFKPDGTAAITYDPITLADGSVIAGFYLRPINREFGNEAPGQVVLVNNYPRSFTHGSIYEWRLTSYQDERYAKCISQKVKKTISAADPAKIIVCDDGENKTYYVFLNDSQGTVLVNRYDLDVWTVYRSELTTDVKKCCAFHGGIVFLNGDTLYTFTKNSAYDDSPELGGDPVPVKAVWESGYMSFGAPFRKKYSSTLWVSMLPEHFADMEVTVKTDKRDDYITKKIGYLLANFTNVDFSNFSFLTWAAPKIKRVQLKVKKFVYYKLIFRVTKPGARATILGYDQQVRYSSNVK